MRTLLIGLALLVACSEPVGYTGARLHPATGSLESIQTTFNASVGGAGSGDESFPLTLAAGTNIVVWVGYHVQDAGAITSVTIDGGAATLIKSDTGYSPVSIHLYRRAIGNKSAGNITIAIDVAGPNGGDVTWEAMAFNDVDQTTPETATPISASFVETYPSAPAAARVVSVAGTDANALMGAIAISIDSTDLTAYTGNTDRGVSSASAYARRANAATRPSAASGSLNVGFADAGLPAAGIIGWEAKPAGGGDHFGQFLPEGWTTITDYEFTDEIPISAGGAPIGSDWSAVNATGLLTRVTDTSLPGSPSVARFTYPVGFSGGVSPGVLYYTGAYTPYTDHFVEYTFKVSNPYHNHPSPGTKQWYPYSATANYVVQFVNGSTIWLYVQAGDGYGDSYNLPGNVNNPVLTLGVEHHLAILHRFPSAPGARDAVFQWWIDGVLCGNYTSTEWSAYNVATPACGGNCGKWNAAATYTEPRLYPVWGGTGSTVATEGYMQFNRFRLARP